MVEALHLPASAERSPGPTRFIGLGLCLRLVLFYFWHHPPVSLLLLVIAAILVSLRLEIALALLPLTFPYYVYLRPLTTHRRSKVRRWCCPAAQEPLRIMEHSTMHGRTLSAVAYHLMLFALLAQAVSIPVMDRITGLCPAAKI